MIEFLLFHNEDVEHMCRSRTHHVVEGRKVAMPCRIDYLPCFIELYGRESMSIVRVDGFNEIIPLSGEDDVDRLE